MFRRGRSRRKPNRLPLTTAQRFASLFTANDSWFDADNVAVDGSSRVTGWVDYMDPTHQLAQANTGLMSPTPTVDAALAGAKSTSFAGGKWYESNRAASAWKHLHDGTGSEWMMVYVPSASNNTFLATCNAAGATVGYYVSATTGSSSNLASSILNGSGSSTFVFGSCPVVNGTGTYLGVSVRTAQHLVTHRGTAAGSNTPAALSSADPLSTLRVGAGTTGPGSAAGLNPADYRLHAVYVWKRVLTASERATVQSFVLSKTGIAAP